MIEYFRHEAMNQATVISGFCEIIETFLIKNPRTFNDAFPPVLQKISSLVQTFNETLSAFHEECAEIALNESQLLALNPQADITSYISDSCRIQFDVLKDFAKEMVTITQSVTIEAIGNEVAAKKYLFIVESAVKLHELFLHPVVFLQSAVSEHQSS